MNRWRKTFLSQENFALAWDKVRGNHGCAGVDGETIEQFDRHRERNLADICRAVAQGTYRPLPLRQIFIPKLSGWRELGVPTVRDRLVQQALLQILHPLLEPQFEPVSFAYRPGRSHLMAVDQVASWQRRGYGWVLDADIVQYFDQVQHQRLLAEVQERVEFPAIVQLLEQWIGVGKMTQAGLVLPRKGIAQGSVVSPILANVYLDDFDEIWQASRLKLVRFADDFVLLGRSERQVREAQDEVAAQLAEMGLSLHPEKTRITHFQKGFEFLGHVFVGDLVVPSKPAKAQPQQPDSRQVNQDAGYRVVHADPPGDALPLQQALIEALRATDKPIPPPLMVVFGYAVRPYQPVAIQSEEVSWQKNMATLYLIQQETQLRKDGGRFIVTTELRPGQAETVEVLIQEVERILVFGNVQLTTAVIATCLELHIPVIFLSQLGEYKGHLWSAEFADLAAESAQFHRWQDPVFQVSMARSLVQGKLWNSKQLLLKVNRKRRLPQVGEAVEALNQAWTSAGRVDGVEQLDVLRGHEGSAAARYFPAFGQLITNPGFVMSQRSRRPPKDAVNSLLSFGYTLLYNAVLGLVLAEGLNPYLGNLHRSERRETHLAFDLMEEFRSPVVDALVLKLINQKILRPTDFTWPDERGGIYLNQEARRVFLKYFEQRLSEKLAHPDVSESVSYRRVIQLQVQRYKRAVVAGSGYEPFRRVT